jgi:hypothetical protein
MLHKNQKREIASLQQKSAGKKAWDKQCNHQHEQNKQMASAIAPCYDLSIALHFFFT